MKRNRASSLILAVLLCLSLLSGPIKANAAETSTHEITILNLSPRFKFISQISASLSISNFGNAGCGGLFYIYDIYDGYDSRMTMVLQRYGDSGWTDVEEWSQDFTGTGVKMMDKSCYVSAGYRYRMTATVEILDSAGKVLETVSCDSPIKEY